MRTNPYPEYSLLRESDSEREARHLIVLTVNGPGETILIQFSAGFHSEITRGTEYETRKKADDLAQEWTTKEGFKLASDSKRIFEPLPHILALARFMGHRVVYDDRFSSNRNFTGEVSLEKWPGMTAKNGGGYEYSYTGTMILARPTLPPNHALNMRPNTNAEAIEVIRKSVGILNTVGPAREFVLG